MPSVDVKCPNCGFYNEKEIEDPYDGEEYEACECNNCGGYFKFILSMFTEFHAEQVENDHHKTDKPYDVVTVCAHCNSKQVNKVWFPAPGVRYTFECKDCCGSYSVKLNQHIEYTTSDSMILPLEECDKDAIRVKYE